MIPNSQFAYVLHSRPYRETSLIVDAFTREGGMVSMVAKGARAPGRNNKRALLQPFTPLTLQYSGRSDLKTLTGVDSAGSSIRLTGQRLICGLYCNELMIRLLATADPHPELFAEYENCLVHLSGSNTIPMNLRRFEFAMLEALGYAPDLGADNSGRRLEPDCHYRWDRSEGLQPAGAGDKNAMAGHAVLAIANGDWHLDGVLPVARQLTRGMLDELLGDKPLQSRELLRQSVAQQSGSD